MRRSSGSLVLGLLVAVSAAGGCATPSPDVEGAGCAPASPAVVAVASGWLSDGGRLRHAYITRSLETGTMFLSAELVDPDDESDKGDIFTWTVAPGPGALRAESVDEHARQHSSAPVSQLRPDDEASLRSRGCTYLTRGLDEFTGDALATCWKVDDRAERHQCDLQAKIAREAPPGSAEWP